MTAGPPTDGPSTAGPHRRRREPLFPNALQVARREYREKVGSRLFHVSTVLLAALAMIVAFTPVIVRALDQGSVTRVGVVASDTELEIRAVGILDGVLNGGFSGGDATLPEYRLERASDRSTATADVAAGRLDAALIAERQANGRIDFTFLTGEAVSSDRAYLVGFGTLAVALLDWTARNEGSGVAEFLVPSYDTRSLAGPSSGGAPISAAEYAGRRLVGIVLVFLIFITLIVYGMWVAAGVVAEKSSRVMELLVGAASTRQLIVGKVLGIGLAGLSQYLAVLAPALLVLTFQDRLGDAILGPGAGAPVSVAALSPGLIAAFLAFFVLGFILYALVYAAAGSLISRPEDLQLMALPMSLVAIVGYLAAIAALTGGTAGFIRLASLVPFWSPFVMLTRLSIGRVEAWELALAFGLLLISIPIVLVVAIRVYAAGVLLYGQRPGVRRFVAAALGR